MSDRVRVYTKSEAHDYDVVIEPAGLERLGQHVLHHAPAHSYAIIADSTVFALYAERAAHALEATGAAVVTLQFPAGEANKNPTFWAALSDQLAAHGVARDGCVVALGGGVTTDLAGFVAATYMRGIALVQVPTTLLAMIDASIGGKTGLDAAAAKNLIGAFHQPRVVLVDPHLLRTLADDEMRCGLAEAVKHGAIYDAEYVAWIAGASPQIFEHKTHTLASLIARSIEIKAHFVSEDVHEKGARAALNFGHTIGHALESVTEYRVPHGHAVAMGMIVEAKAGAAAGITEQETAARLCSALQAVGLPTELPAGLDHDAVLAATRSDKKTRAGEQRYTLLARVGQVARTASGEWTTPLPDDVVKAALV